MSFSDRDLGMDRAITRRDFLDGVAVAVGSAMVLPAGLEAIAMPQEFAPEKAADYYPPSRTGMRGAHPGSFEAAHADRDGRTWDSAEDTRETYDLVVVGGGLSGLSAAYFFRKMTSPDAKVLVLDNHDDFGGHAKRNEIVVGNQTLLATGGTGYMVRPPLYPAAALEMLADIGVPLEPSGGGGGGQNQSSGLQPAVFFDKETFGTDRLVLGGNVRRPTAEFLAKTPLSEQVRADLLRLSNDKRDYLSGLSENEKIQKLQKVSYKDYLLNVAKIHPDALVLVGGVWCLSAECVSAWFAMYRGSPGFQGLGLTRPPDSPADPKIAAEDVRFPAGNSDIARMIVRSLIPEALAKGSMGDIELKRVNYARLDEASSSMRLRLNSTAVRVRHVGSAPTTLLVPDAREVEVTYVRGEKAYRVRGRGCVLACYNAMVPYLCPELPAKQKDALHLSARAVNLHTNIVLKDWKAFEKLGVSNVSSPGSFFSGISVSGGRKFGTYAPPRSPADPTMVSMGPSGVLAFEPMVRGLRGGKPMPANLPLRAQLAALRTALYQFPFESFERNIREQLTRTLSAGGFDPARDIQAIILNRWPHGFALGANSLFDPEWPEDEAPHVVGRKRFGRITIANSDASGIDLTQTAFDEAHRAVTELMSRRFGYFSRI